MACRLVCKRWRGLLDVWWPYSVLQFDILTTDDMYYACAKGCLISMDTLTEELIGNIDIEGLRALVRGYVHGGHLGMAKDGIEQFEVSRHDPIWQELPALLLNDPEMDPVHVSAFLAWFKEYCETNPMAQEEPPDYVGMVERWR